MREWLMDWTYMPRWSVFLVIAMGMFFGFLIGVSLNSKDDWGDDDNIMKG